MHYTRRHHHDVVGVEERLDVLIDLVEGILVQISPSPPKAIIVFQGVDVTPITGPTPGPITIADNQTVAAGIALENTTATVVSVVWSVDTADVVSTPSADTTTTSIAGVPGSDGTTDLSAVVTLSDGTTLDATTLVTTTAPVAVPTATIVFGTPS